MLLAVYKHRYGVHRKPMASLARVVQRSCVTESPISPDDLLHSQLARGGVGFTSLLAASPT